MSELPTDDRGPEVVPEPADVPVSTPSRRRAIAALAAVVVLLATVLVVAFAPKGRPIDGVLPPDPTGYAMPDVTLPLVGGGTLSLASLRGKPVVVNFWASWCTTCLAEAALLGRTERVWRAKGVVFIGMDSSDTDPAAQAFAAKYGMQYRSLADRTGAQTPRWGVTGYPETFFIGRDGRIRGKFVSAIDAASLQSRLAQIAAS